MKPAGLAPERLAELVERFSSCRIAVLGDFFLDKYLDVDPALEETSLETGRPCHQVVNIRSSPGAAGTVVGNLAALGAMRLDAIGFTGDDGEGYDLRKALAGIGCSSDHLHVVTDRRTPTYLKPRDETRARLDAEHDRYDTKNRKETPKEIERKIIASLDVLLPDVHAVVVMDQVDKRNCGVVTDTVREAVAKRAAASGDVLFWADSRRRIHEYRNVIIKPNEFEALGIGAPSQGDEVDLEELQAVGASLRERNDAPVVVTRGERGMIVSDPEWTIVPGVTVEGQIDPTGAGDSATAGTVLSLCAGAELPEAAVVGNLVASITVKQIGTTGVARPEELAERLALWERQRQGAGS